MPGVEKTMREWKKGTLKSGSGKKITSRQQALAVGLSEERRAKYGKKGKRPLGAK